jgi:predicted acylesterase/phospholipase RssA
MNLLSISGGSTKIAGLAGAIDSLVNKFKYKPDVIVGTSAGSILSLPIALGYWALIKRVTTNFTLDQIFSVSPVNKKGEISLIGKLRVLFGKNSLGKQDNLIKTLRGLITEKDFNKYLRGDYPTIYIGMVNFNTGSRKYQNIKECTYEEYLNCVMASTSIPYAVEPVFIKGEYYFDGGTRDHIGSHWVMENIDGITENVSVFSRPENFSSLLDTSWKPKNIFSVFERDQDIRVLEISKKDEKLEKLIAEDKNIKHTAIFIPKVLNGLYDTNKDGIKKLYREGYKSTTKYYKV